MNVIEIFRAGKGRKEFCFRMMGRNYKEIWRASETYKRKATMRRVMAEYCPLGVQIVDLTTKEMEQRLTAGKPKR